MAPARSAALILSKSTAANVRGVPAVSARRGVPELSSVAMRGNRTRAGIITGTGRG